MNQVGFSFREKASNGSCIEITLDRIILLGWRVRLTNITNTWKSLWKKLKKSSTNSSYDIFTF